MSKFEEINKSILILITALFLFFFSYTCLAGVGGIVIEIKDKSGKVVQTTFSDTNGFYESELLPVGEYTVTIYPQNRSPISKIVVIDAEEQACDFDLVSGTIGGALVQLYKDGSTEVLAQATTTEDGSFEFGNLAPGKYQLVISKHGYISKSVPIELKEGETYGCFEQLERESGSGFPQGSPYEILAQDSEALLWLVEFVEKGLSPGFPYDLNPQEDPIPRIDAAVVLARVLGTIESKPVALTAEEKKALSVLKEEFRPELGLIGAFVISNSTERLAADTKVKLYQMEREKEGLAKKQEDLAYKLGTTAVVKIRSSGGYECWYDENNDTSKLMDVTVRPELWVQSEPTAAFSIVAVLRSFYTFAGTRGLNWRQFSVDYNTNNISLTLGDYETKLTPYTFWSYNPTPSYPFESFLESIQRTVQLREQGLYDHNWTLRGIKASFEKGPLVVDVFGAPTLGKTSTANGQFITALKSDLSIGNLDFGLTRVSLFDDKLSNEPQKGSVSNNVLSLIAKYNAKFSGQGISLGLESAFSSFQESKDAAIVKANAISGSLETSIFNFKLINNPKDFYSLSAQRIGMPNNLHEFYTMGGDSSILEPEAFTFGQATPNRKGWVLSSNFITEGFLRGQYIFSLARASENEASDSLTGLKKYKTWNFGFLRKVKAIPVFKYPAKVGMGAKVIESQATNITNKITHTTYGVNLTIEPKQNFSVLMAYSQDKNKDDVSENKVKAGVQYHLGGPFSIISWYTKITSGNRKAELVDFQLDYEF